MATFSMTAADDLLGLATDDDIVLVDRDGGPVKQFVEVLNHDASWVTAATQSIRPVEEFTSNYELVSSTLSIPLGSLVNTDYLVTSVAGTCSSESYPTVQVGFVKFSAAAKFNSGSSQTGTVTFGGGFGLVDKRGATFSQGVSSRLTINILTADALEETSGDFLADGYVVYGMKREISVEAYDAITAPASSFTQSEGTRKARDGWTVNRWNGFTYF